MGSPGEEFDGGASSRPFVLDQSQEEFDREFFGQILRHSDRNTDVVRRQAELLARHGDYARALRLDRVLAERCPDDAVVHYNMACSLSMVGQLDEAVGALRIAIELGYSDFAHLMADPDLDALRELSSFQELMRRRIPDDEPPRIA